MFDSIRNKLVMAGQQRVHKQSDDGNQYPDDGLLTQAKVEAHLAGEATYALNLVSEDGTGRLAHWDYDYTGDGKPVSEVMATAICKSVYTLCNALTALGLPEPLISVSGRKGIGVWLPMERNVPASTVRKLLRLTKERYCVVDGCEVDLRPDSDTPGKGLTNAKMPPCLHRGSGLWSGFIKLDELHTWVDRPGMTERPDMVEQQRILDAAGVATSKALFAAVAALEKQASPQADDTAGTPDYSKAEPGYLSPCMAGLIKGVPDQFSYNRANLTLAGYCKSAGIDADIALELATTMAENSPQHTGKPTVADKVRHFKSNTNPPAFKCGYMLAQHARDAFGGDFGCETCAIRPAERLPQYKEALPQVKVEEAVALDALAFAWQNRRMLPPVSSVWPVLEISPRAHLPVYRLAADLLPDPSAGAFFSAVEKWMATHAQNEPNRPVAASMFIDRVLGHKVTESAFNAAVDRLVELERRTALLAAAHSTLARPELTTASSMAVALRGAAEDALRAHAVEGPLNTLADKLLADLAAPYNEGVQTPIPGLNDILHGGFKAGRLYTLVAGPKSGKTTLAAQCMDHAAAAGHPVLYLGYEMGRQQMVEYAMARRLGLNSRWIEQRRLNREQAQLLVTEMRRYLANEGRLLTIMEAGPRTSLADAAAWVEGAKASYPGITPLIVIDYLQLANTGDPDIDRHQSDTKRVTGLAVASKDLARKTGAAVLALSAITKEAEMAAVESGDLDVTAARDALAIIHASDGVLVLNSQSKVIQSGSGTNKKSTHVDQWQMYAELLTASGESGNGSHAAKRATELEVQYPLFDRETFGHRVRLAVPRHRGATGSIPLYHYRAHHRFLEVPLLTETKASDGAKWAALGVQHIREHMETLAAFQSVPEAPVPTVPSPAPQNPPEAPTESSVDIPMDMEYITDLEAAKEALVTFADADCVAIDFETTSLHPNNGQTRLLQVAEEGSFIVDGRAETRCKVFVIDLWAVGGLGELKEALQGLKGVAHNACFELLWLMDQGIEVDLDCTMLAHHVLTGKRESLKALAKHYLGIDLPKEQQKSDWSAPELTEAQLQYAAMDAAVTLRIWQHIQERFADKRRERRAYEVVRGAQFAVTTARLNGMPFDVDGHRQLMDGLTVKEAELAQTLRGMMGEVNPNSTKQMTEWLTERLGDKADKWPKTGSGLLATGADVLEANAALLSDDARVAVDVMVQLKDTRKKLSTFGETMASKVSEQTGRIHCDYSLAGTVTGRMSCSEPNLQQIPRDKEYRGLFRPTNGRVFVIADYAAIELRVAAVLANATELINAFDKGLDAHRLTASKVLGIPESEVTKAQRQMAKAVNFGLLYGMGSKGLQSYARASYGVELTEQEADKLKKAWHAAYPEFGRWQSDVGAKTKRSLLTYTPSGRPRSWPNQAEYKLTEALNTPVQGGAAEGMLCAMDRLQVALAPHAIDIVHVVHDELVLECDPVDADTALFQLTKAMTEGMLEVFPNMPTTGLVEAKVAHSWADK